MANAWSVVTACSALLQQIAGASIALAAQHGMAQSALAMATGTGVGLAQAIPLAPTGKAATVKASAQRSRITKANLPRVKGFLFNVPNQE
ncbi:hypothetical protein EON81_19700, partial [bacterium]